MIKIDIEMPKGCRFCPVFNGEFGECQLRQGFPSKFNDVHALFDERPRNCPLTDEFPFTHVKIKHPRFGECDGWLDKQRQLLFFDFITTELARKYNWVWKEADNGKEID